MNTNSLEGVTICVSQSAETAGTATTGPYRYHVYASGPPTFSIYGEQDDLIRLAVMLKEQLSSPAVPGSVTAVSLLRWGLGTGIVTEVEIRVGFAMISGILSVEPHVPSASEATDHPGSVRRGTGFPFDGAMDKWDRHPKG